MNAVLTSFTRKISWRTANLLSCCTFISTPGRPNLTTSLLKLRTLKLYAHNTITVHNWLPFSRIIQCFQYIQGVFQDLIVGGVELRAGFRPGYYIPVFILHESTVKATLNTPCEL